MFSKEITVSKKFLSKYKTISQAIESAAPGTTIYVEPGVYHESLVIDKEITLIGKGSREEIVVYSSAQSPLFMRTNKATVRGITIQHGGQPVENKIQAAVILSTGSLRLEDCVIKSSVGDGIRIFHRGTTPVIRRCLIDRVYGTGMFIFKEAEPFIENCQVIHSGRSGIWFTGKSAGTVENCQVYGSAYANIGIDEEANPVIRNCDIYRSRQNGIWIKSNSYGTIENCTIHHNAYTNVEMTEGSHPIIKNCKIYNSSENGIWCKNNSRGTIVGCEIFQNGYANVVISEASDPVLKDCKIYGSQEGGIWIREKGQGQIEGCEVYANAYHNVEITGNSYFIIKDSQLYESEKCGIWIDGQSQAVIEDSSISRNANANVLVTQESEIILNRCNVFAGERSGVWFAENSFGTVENCDIYQNTYANIGISTGSNPTIKYCRIYESEQNGIWIKDGSTGTIENCEIFSNQYTNVELDEESKATIRDCQIYNSEQCGIWFEGKSRGTVENCSIFGNMYSNIGITQESDPLIISCKLYESEQNGIWLKERARGTIEHCEIYRNTYPNIAIETEANPIIRNCNIYESKSNGVFVTDNGYGTLENCVVHDNEKDDIWVSEDSDLKVFKPRRSDELETEEQPLVHHEAAEERVDLDEVLAELNQLIGLENVKQEIQRKIEFIRFNQELENFGVESGNIHIAANHTVLYGNPGTGKTTIAKLLGKLYNAMGLLPSSHVVEVNREKLVGEYIGQTAPKTKAKIDEAMGGVLFIDEAYALTNKGSDKDFGSEAIEVLLEEMEKRKGEFIVVVAGYDNEMKAFLEANPGLKSRFTDYFYLHDYTPDEMVAIARKIASDHKRTLSPDAEELLFKEFTALWRQRDEFFANARTVRNYIEKMLQVQPQRCMQVPKEQWTKEFLTTLTAEDVEAILPKNEKKTFNLPIQEDLLAETLEQLHRMIGIEQIKAEIEKTVTLVRFYKEEGRDLTDLLAHTLLVGNPGTGKTEIGRIIAKIYQALGILERGDLIEVKRDQLVSSYAGETEKLTAKYIDEAMGGTLFIDEAYQLTQYGAGDPGHKAVEVLLKRMEDNRGEFLVIAAGYKANMEQFLDSNDGLRRRFAKRIEFEDYTPTELMQISELFLSERGYRLSAEAFDELIQYYKHVYDGRDHTFGNAGLARNIVLEAIKNLDYRVAKLPKEERTESIMKTIQPVDLPFNH